MSTAAYFGTAWNPVVARIGERVELDPGRAWECGHCETPILPGDSGILIPAKRNADPDPALARYGLTVVEGRIAPIHIECHALLALGHDAGVCTCRYEDHPVDRDVAVEFWRRIHNHSG